ncbi:MAG: S9 family peptidase [Sphingomonadaceae bacterium]
MKPWCLAVAAAIALAVPAAAQTAFEPADIYRLQWVSDPVVASDGRRVLFTRARFDEATDRRQAALWLAHLDAEGRVVDQRLLVPESAGPRAAGFSPDGSRIAYVAQHMGRPQLFVMTLADPVGRLLTTGDVPPEAPVWSPDGRRIAFVGKVPSLPLMVTGLPDRPKGAERAPEAKVVTDLFWRTDSGGEEKPGFRHLFVIDAQSGALTQLTTGDRHAVESSGIAWTRDGRHLIASVAPDPVRQPGESDLWRFDSTRAGAAPARLTSRPGSEIAASVSPDGRTLAFIGAEASNQFYLMPEAWLMPMAGGTVRKAAPALDRPIAGPLVWREDSAALFALYHDAGVTRVGEIDATTGQVTVRVREVGGTRLYLPSAGGSFAHAAGTFAYTSSFTDRPNGLGISRGAGETGAIDPNARWAEGKRAGRIEEVRATSRADGREIQGWLMFPPDFAPGRRYPLILDIHGGPNTDYGPFFSVTHALYAASGYIVLFTNPRGSIGYGREFANLITGTYPGADHDDLMSMVDAVAARPYVDQRNLFIGGGSGGGVLTLNAIGREPGKFRAAVALRPVTDWVNQATTSDSPAFFARQWMGGLPWEDPEGYRSRSPFWLTGQMTTPTMLITGEMDYRTPMSQTEMMFGALKLQGVETVMVRLPEANHGMGRPSQWLQSVLAPIDFFNRHRAK